MLIQIFLREERVNHDKFKEGLKKPVFVVFDYEGAPPL